MRHGALERRIPLRRVPPRSPQRAVSPATEEQRALVRDVACIVCAQGPCDPAHLIDRSLAPSWGDDPRIVVALCRRCHRLYDDHDLDLSPFLEPYYRDAVAVAVQAVGLFRALNRITGKAWMPIEAAA